MQTWVLIVAEWQFGESVGRSMDVHHMDREIEADIQVGRV